MGFAIPISDAISVINDLMDREVLSEEEKGYLGVQGTDITEAVQQSYPNMPLGFYVSALSENGAAEKAGAALPAGRRFPPAGVKAAVPRQYVPDGADV